jgi:hypothetical protein
MTTSNKINIKELQQIAKNSANSETYQPLDKTKYYRIGVGQGQLRLQPLFSLR